MNMKKTKDLPSVGTEADDDILPEYDFSRSRPNKYAAQYTGGSVVVTLDPDVADVFPSAVEANEALRTLASIIRDHESHRGKRKQSA